MKNFTHAPERRSGGRNSFIWLVLLIGFLSLGSVQAQSLTVKGKVVDENAMSIPGASVLVKGTTKGAATDINGEFSLTLSESEKELEVSFIGYNKKEVAIGNQSEITISLTPEETALSEVVVTALGVKRDERALGYTVQQVDTRGLDEAKETNIVNSLTGKIAGVQISNSSGNIGGSSRITIRGINSISGNNQPLFVVDGTPIDNSNYNSTDQVSGNGGRDYGNAAQDINPDDVESISVLKGPSASALYGSRASNGVILITTKSGAKNKGIGVSINSSTMVSNVFLLPEMQNEYGGGFSLDFEEVVDPLDGLTYKVVNTNANNSWGPRFDGTPVRHWDSMYPGEPNYGEVRPWQATPNNIRDFFETGVTLSNNVSISGGDDKSSFRLSYTNLDQTGVMPNSSLNRNTIAVSANTQITDKFSAGAKINYIRTEALGRPATGDWSPERPVNVLTYWYAWTQRQIDPARLRNYQSDRYYHMTWNTQGLGRHTEQSYNNNPYFTLFESYNNDLKDRVFGNINISYQILPELSVTLFARTDFYTDVREDRASIGGYLQNAYEKDLYNFREDNFELLGQYNTEFGDDFSLGVTFGGNIRKNTFTNNYTRTQGGLSVPNFYNLVASLQRPEIRDFKSEREVHSIYASGNLGYRDFLFLEASLRNDWSSTLPVDNNSYLYPAVSSSFVFSNLMTGADFISFGKMRLGWAQVGNDTDPYRLINTYANGDPYANTSVFTVDDVLRNSNLKPEIVSNLEAGLDLRFLENRIGLDFTVYKVNTFNQILALPVSSTTGFQSLIVNAGEMENKGIEVMLSGTPIERNDFSWDVNLNLARNRNRVLELAEGQDNFELGGRDGTNSVNATVGQPYGTIITPNVIYHEETGKPIVGSNGFYLRNPGEVVGSILPDVTGGFSNTFTYRGITLSALIDFQSGGSFWSETVQNGIANGQFIESVGDNDRGVPKRNPVSEGGGIRADAVFENGEPNTVYLEAQNYLKQLYSLDALSVYDASYIKLREISLGYNVPSGMLRNLFINGLRVSVFSRNVALLHSNVPHIDPSEIAYGSSNVQGLEGASLPAPRMIGFNINIKL
ncbi:SusC/RagA family TonB-linked outer membrane protein [Cyclobacterium xiamenense]|uniref:SusC/RagA family TonB-linked outer membrane protein n=1 Tax=Cyclobacterium xiamenense TaxID=1297121 RepID=UPI0012B9850E|nr:SusC/RagA family TonB-linked outer membrane protein [Cyclobacterium xiamenense]